LLLSLLAFTQRFPFWASYSARLFARIWLGGLHCFGDRGGWFVAWLKSMGKAGVPKLVCVIEEGGLQRE
jgi:hypothetical protein